MPVLVSLKAFRPASGFVSWDRDALRNPARFIPVTFGGHWRNDLRKSKVD
jgi:hypothetical protein